MPFRCRETGGTGATRRSATGSAGTRTREAGCPAVTVAGEFASRFEHLAPSRWGAARLAFCRAGSIAQIGKLTAGPASAFPLQPLLEGARGWLFFRPPARHRAGARPFTQRLHKFPKCAIGPSCPPARFRPPRAEIRRSPRTCSAGEGCPAPASPRRPRAGRNAMAIANFANLASIRPGRRVPKGGSAFLLSRPGSRRFGQGTVHFVHLFRISRPNQALGKSTPGRVHAGAGCQAPHPPTISQAGPRNALDAGETQAITRASPSAR
jgi:hypothetical protein